ncbi:conserved hypothetical protein [uncultured Paludibacter sp.]|nr:conserved hypothetical protein [uncultured Paludibacter sp.]
MHENNSSDVQIYELEKARFIIKDAVQLDISYAYDDLIFSEHGLFIIQFVKENKNKLYCWFNTTTTNDFKKSTFTALETTCNLNKMIIEYKGDFEISQKENGEELDIKFIGKTQIS